MGREPDFERKQKVDGFLLEEPLGIGQDGEVWRATRVTIKKRCAIKFLNSVQEPQKRERFDREIEILAALDHPHIVQIQDKGEAWNPRTKETVPYYVMEYVAGVPIIKALSDFDSADRFEAICVLFQQVLSGLDAAHAIGITHGDIKSPNILVVPRDRIAKLSDFGFGLLPGASREERSIYPDSSYRVPADLLPEQADIYRLGKTIGDCVDRLIPKAINGSLATFATELINRANEITARDAASLLRAIRVSSQSYTSVAKSLTTNVPELSRSAAGISLVNDPIHGVINLSPRVRRLLDREVFQRLRQIVVSPAAELVFPTLSLTGFELALGEHAMLVQQIKSVAGDENFSSLVTEASHLSALLLGGLLLSATLLPFGEALRTTIFSSRDLNMRVERIFQDPELQDVIASDWELEPSLVKALINGRNSNESNSAVNMLGSFLYGPLCSSAIEWVRRVPERAGLPISFDLQRLLSALRLNRPSDREFLLGRSEGLVVHEKGLPAIEQFLLARFNAEQKISRHPVVRASNLMLSAAFEGLQERGVAFETFIDTDQISFLLHCLNEAHRLDAAASVDLITRFRNRRLHRRVVAITLDNLDEFHRIHMNRTSNVNDLNAKQIVIEQLRRDISWVLSREIRSGELLIDIPSLKYSSPVYIVSKQDGLRSVYEVSPILASLQTSAHNRRVTLYGSPEIAEQVKEHSGQLRDILFDVVEDVYGRYK